MRKGRRQEPAKHEVFAQAVEDYKIPPLVLNQRWHQLFQRLKKTEQIRQLEEEMNRLLCRRGELNEEDAEYRRLKSKLLHTIVHNMDGTTEKMEDSLQSRILEKNSSLVGEINQKMQENEKMQEELPKKLEEVNRQLMLCTMELCYQKAHENSEEIAEISAWLSEFREELKKRVIRKRACESGNRDIYQFLEQIFGMDLLQLFEIDYAEFLETTNR